MIIFNQGNVYETVSAFQSHRTVAFPTDTVYGVGVMYGSLEDLERLKQLKARDANKPIPFMVSNLAMLKTIAKVDLRTKKLMARFLPGPLTLVLPLKEGIDKGFTNGNDSVAVRIPDDHFVLDVIDHLGKPLMVTSANQSGRPAALTMEQAKEELPDVDVIVQGVCRQMQASTIVDCTKDSLEILRPGPITAEELNACIR
ncbi:MAG: threonylcarbamoyl-AMP synthase [Erysipelotrichaceae bacterium]|nr:threonylcarbamoyl-AMP synthase [Erysipelotrichaceae bacterium]